MPAQLLIGQGHGAVLHVRNGRGGQKVTSAVPVAETLVIGDPASIVQIRIAADKVNRLGPFEGGAPALIVLQTSVFRIQDDSFFLVRGLNRESAPAATRMPTATPAIRSNFRLRWSLRKSRNSRVQGEQEVK